MVRKSSSSATTLIFTSKVSKIQSRDVLSVCTYTYVINKFLKFPLLLCVLGWGTSRRNRPVGHGLFERARSLLQLSFFRKFDFGDPAIRKSGIRGNPSHDSHSSSLNSATCKNHEKPRKNIKKQGSQHLPLTCSQVGPHRVWGCS